MAKLYNKIKSRYRDFLAQNTWQVIILIVLALVFSLPSVISYARKLPIPKVGEIAQDDVIAPVDFKVEKPESIYNEEKRAVIRSIPVIVEYQPRISDSMMTRFDSLWTELVKISQSAELSTQKKIKAVSDIFPNMSEDEIEQLLIMKDLRDFGRILKASLRIAYGDGFVNSEPIPGEENPELFKVKKGGEENIYSYSVILNDSTVKIILKNYLDRQYQKLPERVQLGLNVLENFLEPNLVVNIQETRQRREKAVSQISRVQYNVSKGEKIIGKHEKIDQEAHQKLVSLYKTLQGQNKASDIITRILATLGTLGLAFLVIILFAMFMFMWYRDYWNDLRFFATMMVSAVIVGVIAHILRTVGLTNYAIPILLVPVIVASLSDDWLAFASALTVILLVGIGFRTNSIVIISYIIVSAIVSFRARRVQMRNLFYRPVTYSTLAGVFSVAVLGVLVTGYSTEIFRYCAEFGVSTVVSPFLALLLLPVAEKISGRVSAFSLMDLADLSSIILRKLAVEAPGTFNHSVLVGNTAAAAAEAIGANPILARAGGYYHDIGKLVHPQYFEENQTGRNPHDSLSPFESFRMITSHTKEGVEIGKSHKLPKDVLNIIEQHHGTSVTEYFYLKAKDINPTVTANEFRYPGPKPQTVESALIMICDIVEAALRSQRDSLPETEKEIKAMVTDLVIEKIEDGQFDSAPISFADIKITIDTIIPILRGVHHSRVSREYRQEYNLTGE